MKDIYKTYSPETLAADPDFIDWIKKKSGVNRQLWNDWLKKNPDSHSLVQEAESIVRRFNFSRIDTSGAAGRIWDRIEESTKEEGPSSNQKAARIRPLRILIAVIAAGLALLLYFQFFVSSDQTIQTFAGQDQIQTLPDASSVHLNDASMLSYDDQSYSTERTLRLEGEAFFEVTKGAPFIVQTDQGSIEVLGTSFNVFSRESGFEVRCYTGKVRVKSKKSEVVLLPGQMFSTLSEGGLKGVEKFDQEKYKDWRQGFFSFQDASLSDVVDEIERQYDVRVILDKDIPDVAYTGFFTEGELEEALHSVCWPLNLTWKIDQENVKISRNR